MKALDNRFNVNFMQLEIGLLNSDILFCVIPEINYLFHSNYVNSQH